MFFLIVLLILYTVSSGQLIPPHQALRDIPLVSNTSTSSNALKTYIIYSFVDGPSLDSKNEEIRLHLEMMLSPADLQEYGGAYTGVEFWRVKMTDMQYTAFTSANPRAQILENTLLLYHDDLSLSQDSNETISDRDQFSSVISNFTDVGINLGAETIYQIDAPSDLKVVSWASSRKPKAYAYDPEAGEEATIYLIENGIDGGNREFIWPPPNWLYAPSAKRTETDDDPLSHGSCVASKATGAKNGVSKTTRLVVVKSTLDLIDIAWAFQRIVNIAAKQKRGRVVVLLAATTKTPFRTTLFQDARFSRLFLRMENLISLGAVIVVPSGNYGERSSFADTVPAVFALPSKVPGRQPLPLIVAGTVDNRGAEASFSQNILSGTIWAPGVKVACTKRGWKFRPTDTGTSFSAGMVAGLAAYFLGMKNPPFAVGGPDTSKNLINYFQTSASWARRPGERKVIWNRLDGSLAPLSNATVLPLIASDVSTS